MLLVFHSLCSLQSQSWFYNGPNQDSKIIATCLYQVAHKKLNLHIYNATIGVMGIPTENKIEYEILDEMGFIG